MCRFSNKVPYTLWVSIRFEPMETSCWVSCLVGVLYCSSLGAWGVGGATFIVSVRSCSWTKFVAIRAAPEFNLTQMCWVKTHWNAQCLMGLSGFFFCCVTESMCVSTEGRTSFTPGITLSTRLWFQHVKVSSRTEWCRVVSVSQCRSSLSTTDD